MQLQPNGQVGSLESFTATLADVAEAGSWFPGTPCFVNVLNSGCYLAWSNGTHYFEEGNYDLDGLQYLPGCPNCSRTKPSVPDGECANDGSLSCAGGRVNYRCTATRVQQCNPASLVGHWKGSCSSSVGADSSGDMVCSDQACEQPYE